MKLLDSIGFILFSCIILGCMVTWLLEGHYVDQQVQSRIEQDEQTSYLVNQARIELGTKE